jgi:hypothetical protein
MIDFLNELLNNPLTEEELEEASVSFCVMEGDDPRAMLSHAQREWEFARHDLNKLIRQLRALRNVLQKRKFHT